MANKPVNYVNNKDFYEAMVKYRQSVKNAEAAGKQKPRVPEYVGRCILQISERLSLKYQFRRYSYRDELIGDGVTACIRYIDNFDPDRYKNPFAYFTQITFNAFINRLNKEQTHQYVKARMMKESSTDPGLQDEITDSDPMNGVIDAFENRMAARKKRAAESKARKAAETDLDFDFDEEEILEAAGEDLKD